MRTIKNRKVSAPGICTISLLGLVTPAWSDYRSMTSEVAQFHAFMRRHPGVASDLQANPPAGSQPQLSR
jgi:hypothetical protein